MIMVWSESATAYGSNRVGPEYRLSESGLGNQMGEIVTSVRQIRRVHGHVSRPTTIYLVKEGTAQSLVVS
jgi:hypothetical protein